MSFYGDDDFSDHSDGKHKQHGYGKDKHGYGKGKYGYGGFGDGCCAPCPPCPKIKIPKICVPRVIFPKIRCPQVAVAIRPPKIGCPQFDCSPCGFEEKHKGGYKDHKKGYAKHKTWNDNKVKSKKY